MVQTDSDISKKIEEEVTNDICVKIGDWHKYLVNDGYSYRRTIYIVASSIGLAVTILLLIFVPMYSKGGWGAFSSYIASLVIGLITIAIFTAFMVDRYLYHKTMVLDSFEYGVSHFDEFYRNVVEHPNSFRNMGANNLRREIEIIKDLVSVKVLSRSVFNNAHSTFGMTTVYYHPTVVLCFELTYRDGSKHKETYNCSQSIDIVNTLLRFPHEISPNINLVCKNCGHSFSLTDYECPYCRVSFIGGYN